MFSPPLNLPQAELRTESRGGKPHVFCQVRRKWLVLTPEEWVRQHLIAFIHHGLGCPLSLMRIESGVRTRARGARADIIVCSPEGVTLLLAECKAPDVPIGQDTLYQAARYNARLSAQAIVLSNGMTTYCLMRDNGSGVYAMADQFPDYQELLSRLN